MFFRTETDIKYLQNFDVIVMYMRNLIPAKIKFFSSTNCFILPNINSNSVDHTCKLYTKHLGGVNIEFYNRKLEETKQIIIIS